MSEHEKLRSAIERVQEYVASSGLPRSSIYGTAVQRVIAAAESTLPRTKMVEVWRVEYCVVSGDTRSSEPWRAGMWTFRERIDAEVEANKAMPPNYRCVRVTGPHQQEVPDAG